MMWAILAAGALGVAVAAVYGMIGFARHIRRERAARIAADDALLDFLAKLRADDFDGPTRPSLRSVEPAGGKHRLN